MSKHLITKLLVTAAAVAMLAVTAGAATASSPASASGSAAKLKVVTIVMADPGCHWFAVGGKHLARLTVNGPTAFRNLDEAAVTFKGSGFVRKVAVGQTLAVTKAGTYTITMVGQHSDDNHLRLVVK